MKMTFKTNEEMRSWSAQSFSFEVRRSNPHKYFCVTFSPERVDMAAAFLEAVTEGKPYRWINDWKISVPHLEAEISCANLEQVVEDGDPSQEELLPRTLATLDYFFSRTSSKEVVAATRGAGRGDEVPLDKLAREFGIKPNAARRILRGAGLKPASTRWAWSESGAEEPRRVLRQALKIS